ncbi:methylated-DNA--[protein]-cysteine S-methyltransferase [Pontibacillus sp. ALD_SL1]|uniref:MGMT family protein n=1 Tax=Pontibacillus sp. ALD_SL1 TaxID=2777185 RepID=UPI001A966298|nr:methylated-DNA--[protein]-cysteine S-methyltransferase [Pontibacillus sp. ALD_SL1]QST01269.1 methylated-DNA--[protein]-cysteine S-methyltransferase [Pontibacillus sp. ALD_SL1]
MQPFTKEVIKIIKAIPKGQVMSYGQIAKVAGNPRAARQVARILHSMSHKENLPWHRVVNVKGEIVVGGEEASFTQRDTLEEEGVQVQNGKVSLSRYRYNFDKRE